MDIFDRNILIIPALEDIFLFVFFPLFSETKTSSLCLKNKLSKNNNMFWIKTCGNDKIKSKAFKNDIKVIVFKFDLDLRPPSL